MYHKCQYLAKNASFGQKLVIRSYGTIIVESHLGTSLALIFGLAWDQMDQKCQYLAKKCQYLSRNANQSHFRAKITFFVGRELILWYPNVKKPIKHLSSFVLKTLTGEAPTSHQGRKCVILTPKFGYWINICNTNNIKKFSHLTHLLRSFELAS